MNLSHEHQVLELRQNKCRPGERGDYDGRGYQIRILRPSRLRDRDLDAVTYVFVAGSVDTGKPVRRRIDLADGGNMARVCRRHRDTCRIPRIGRLPTVLTAFSRILAGVGYLAMQDRR